MKKQSNLKEVIMTDSNNNKIAIFSTSDIQRIVTGESAKNLKDEDIHRIRFDGPMSSLSWTTPKRHVVLSNGNIEQAIAKGYKVLVATTRHKASATDEWWINQVGRENVYWADESHGDATCPKVCKGWRNLCADLGVVLIVDEGEREPTWLDIAFNLRKSYASRDTFR